MTVRTDIYLDTRRKKKDGTYPVKLRVYAPHLSTKTKLFPVPKLCNSMTEKEFKSVWVSSKLRSEHKEKKFYLQELLHRAEQVVNAIEYFTFEEFEKKMFRKYGEEQNVFYYYEEIIKSKRKRKEVSTASGYELSMKNIKRFLESKGKRTDRLLLNEVTVEWLNDLEEYMIEEEGKSLATIGIYVRNLRAIYNKAQEEGAIPTDLYPFGKRKYQIPSSKKVKKSLNRKELKLLLETAPKNEYQEEAKDFWFFSYACGGINMKDMLSLRYKDIKDDKVTFIRAKTKSTRKANQKTIVIDLNSYAKSFIEKYGKKDKKSESLVFSIINSNDTATEKHRKIKNFLRKVNQHFKKFAVPLGISNEVSFYWARHSFSTNSIRNGVRMELVGEILGHSDLKVTQGYFAGFEDDVKKELMDKIMDFG